MDFELKAVGENGAEHIGALAIGEVFGVGNGRRVELRVDVEFVAVHPRCAADEEVGIEDSVGFAHQLTEGDADAMVAVPSGVHIPSGSTARLDGDDLKGERLGDGGGGCGRGWCGNILCKS